MDSVVIGDQRPLDGLGGLPVVPDGGGHGQQPLGDAGPDSCGGPAAVAFEVELAFEGVVDRLDPLAGPADRPVAGCLVAAVRADLSCVSDLGQFLGLLIMQRLLRPGTL